MKRLVSRIVLVLPLILLMIPLAGMAGDMRARGTQRESGGAIFTAPPRTFFLGQTSLAKSFGGFSGFTSIDIPGVSLVQANGINNKGLIVGRYEDETGGHGFLLQDGLVTAINIPGNPDTTITDINNKGVMIGVYLDPFGDSHAFMLKGSSVTHLPVAGATPLGINDRGLIVGTYTADGHAHGFLLDDEDVAAIDFPGAIDTWAEEINRRNVIVGTYRDSGGSLHGFVLDDGAFTTIDFPDADPSTWVQGINNRGVIVGMYDVLGRGQNAFILDRGQFTGGFAFPNTADGGTTVPMDMNDRGQVVGWYQDVFLDIHGFILQ